ncbi:alcohol dehydrogenase catalytic domain-containing protein [Nocardia sp. BMG111209]|uniref:alcohol dehydrogenase catalytic domain-containing protein n=1 Tax=Nocardia sp. BMG111209 TaxID=1160137 RepID=UPI001E595F0B|nr:alcohol dehydrogenase catalytic domain-containing protein [Nocardia sp. BMG111209]
MRAVLLDAPGAITVGEVPDAALEAPTDAVVRVIAAGICGTDLRAYAGRPGPVPGPACGHEFVGVVDDLGDDVVTVRRGDVVVAPFMYADGVCVHCVRGVPTSCRAGGMWSVAAGGAQAEAVRVPFADGTLVRATSGSRPCSPSPTWWPPVTTPAPDPAGPYPGWSPCAPTAGSSAWSAARTAGSI